jgi:hypothetical protein
MIRGKTKLCPFGLSVPGGCMSAGGPSEEDESAVISKMVPLDLVDDEKRQAVLEDNLEELLLAEMPERCPFADRVYEDKESVDCKFDENQQSMPAGSAGLNGSPMYPHLMIGNMPKAQYGHPINYYSDDNENTSAYYGIYSLIG